MSKELKSIYDYVPENDWCQWVAVDGNTELYEFREKPTLLGSTWGRGMPIFFGGDEYEPTDFAVSVSNLNCNKTNPLPSSEADGVVEQAESDPTGRGAHEAGAKLDSGKLYAGLVLGDFANALKYVAEVGTFGANKYSKSGWLSVPDGQSRYEDAKIRHWLSRMTGEMLDPDSNLLHLGHEAWNSLATLELYLREQKKACDNFIIS